MDSNQSLSSLLTSTPNSSPAAGPGLGDLLREKPALPTRSDPSVSLQEIAAQEGADQLLPVINAIYGQESGGGQNPATSTDGARGGMQIIPSTFQRYAKPGERIDNPDDNLRVGVRIVKDLAAKFGGDPAKIAAGYFSGDGNVNPGQGTAWKTDAADGNGKRVSSYVSDVLARLGQEPAAKQEQAKESLPDLTKQPKWGQIEASPKFQALPYEEQVKVKASYFDNLIAPYVKADGKDVTAVRNQFMTAKPGMLDSIGNGMNAVRDFMTGVVSPPSTNGEVVMPTTQLPTTSKVPARPEVRAAFKAAWDSASPEERLQMQAAPGWTGQLAREQAGIYEAQAASGASGVTEMLGTRVEDRVARLIKAGEHPDFARVAAEESAKAGVTPGAELAYMAQRGTIGPSNFDFETQSLFDPNAKGSNGLNNPLTRGLAKGALGIGKSITGYNEFLYDLTGLDEHKKAMQSASNWMRNKETAIGDGGDLFSRNFEGAISSIAQQLPLMVAGVKTGAEAIPLAGMALQTFGQEYSDGRSRGQSVGEATSRAALFAAFEVIGEKFGLGKEFEQLRAMARGAPVSEMYRLYKEVMKRELPGEMLTTTGQFAVDKFAPSGVALNPNATFDDYLNQMRDTIIQTVMQSTIMHAGTTGVGRAVAYARDRGPSAGVAEADAEQAKRDALGKWNSDGLTSKLGQPAPATPTAPQGRTEPTGPITPPPAAPTPPGETTAPEAPTATTPPGGETTGETPATPRQDPGQPPAETGTAPAEVSDQDIVDLAKSRYQILRDKMDSDEGLSSKEMSEFTAIAEAKGDPVKLREIFGMTAPAGQQEAAPAVADQGATNGNQEDAGQAGQAPQEVLTPPAGEAPAAPATGEATTGKGGGTIKEPGTPPAPPKTEKEAIQRKALERIAKGTAYFGTESKAQEWLAKVGLTDTHTVERDASGANKWNIVAKKDTENGTQAPEAKQAEAQGQEAPAADGAVTGPGTIAEPAAAPAAEAAPEIASGAHGPVTLYRGVKAGAEGEKTVGGAYFMSPDRKVAETYAGDGGSISESSHQFENLLSAENWVKAKEQLGLPQSATMEDLVNAARAAGHDGVTFKTTNGQEYIVIPKAESKPETPPVEEKPKTEAEAKKKRERKAKGETTGEGGGTIKEPAGDTKPKTEKEAKDKKEAEAKPAEPEVDPVASAIEGNDQDGLTGQIYDGIRIFDATDYPEIFPEDKLIRLPVKLDERIKVEEKLKKLGFRITDRSAETSASERMVISAIHKPAKTSIGDTGEEMGGKVKGDDKKVTLKDATEKELDKFLAALHKANFLDPESNADQNFGTMMFKEAIFEQVRHPLDYIATIIRREAGRYYGDRTGDRKVLEGELKSNPEATRTRMEGLAEKYIERLKLLQETMHAAKTVEEALEAFRNKYFITAESGRFVPNGDGTSLITLTTRNIEGIVAGFARAFAPTQDTTDQTNRVVKKNADNPPVLANIIRKGMKDHRKGRDVSEDDLKNTFGFKGVEFGNWVTQEERQGNLNMVYDGLMDLADTLGWDPKTIGLLGELGMAIGARGSKNTRAAAHFEPDNWVINLTKTSGNGTVSHEWFHALDRIVDSLQKDPIAKAFARKAVNKLAEALKTRIDGTNMEARLIEAMKSSGDGHNRNTPPKQMVFNLLKSRHSYYAPDAFSAWVANTTTFHRNARKMDEGRSENYWSTAVEMLARGFESHMYDLTQGGTPYLVGPSRKEGFLTPKNGYNGIPYPEGEDRKYVAELYKDFLEQFDPVTLAYKTYLPEFTKTHIEGFGWIVLDQHGIDVNSNLPGYFVPLQTEAAADAAIEQRKDEARGLNTENLAYAKLNKQYLEFLKNIDKIMEENGIFKWPEIKNGSMAESMFYHLRQGWWPEDNNALKDYAAKAFGIEKENIDRLKQKQAQEDFEAALARYAGQRIVDWQGEGNDPKTIYDKLVDLYKKQPNLDVRTGDSMINQAYSTPLPIAFAAGQMAHVTSSNSVFDPTGGNGMLVITANPKRVVTIELGKDRANRMRLMETGKVLEGDAVKLIDSDIRPQETDIVLANPPFGNMPKSEAVKSWDGRDFMMGKIDHLIAAKALKAMANNGRAVIILGANKKEGAITSNDRVFLNWLYSNYNVTDHFEVDGSLYSRQGADWPLRVLVVAGRNETVSAYPVDSVVKRVGDFETLWSRVNEARQNSAKVVVGAGKQLDQSGGTNSDGTGVPAGDQEKAGGSDLSGRNNGRGDQAGNVGDGTTGGSDNADAGSDTTGGTGAGGRNNRRDGAGGKSGNGQGGRTGSRKDSGGVTGGTDSNGLSDLSDSDLDNLIGEALGGGTTFSGPTAPAGGPKRERTTGSGERKTGERKTKAKSETAPGESILDGIDGLEDLMGELSDLLGGDKPKPKTEKESKAKRERKTTAKGGKDTVITYTPNELADASLTALNASIQRKINLRQIAAMINDLRDRKVEQEENPTAGYDNVGSRSRFSLSPEEQSLYEKVQPILSAIWDKLTKVIADASQRVKAFVVGLAQKFAGTKLANMVPKFAKHYLVEMRDSQNKLPSNKKPIIADAVDNATQVVYRGRSKGDSSGIFVPRNQATALDRSFDQFESEHGDIDEFVRDELGYKTVDDMHKGTKRGPSQGLAGYQVDALGLAIASMKRGDGFIVGDDTGVGKGRTGAALIAWAIKQGKVPIFFSYKKELYSAMYDDIVDICKEDEVKPIPTDADAEIRQGKKKVIVKSSTEAANAALDHIIKTGEMPPGSNALFTTYYQNNVANKRRQAIAKLVASGKAVLIMDEAHNAAGESNTNQFFMSLLTGEGLFGKDEDGNATAAPEGWKPPDTVYLSATFAKKPSNMPVYVRTQLRHAADNVEDLVSMFASGGDVMQQIASEMLVSSGSMIRRERSYAGVNFNYVTDEENAPRDAREVDAATEILRQIVYADRAFGEWMKTPEGNKVIATLVPPGFKAVHSGSNADVAMNKAEFTSIVHNYVGQLLLATKVKKSVEMAIESLNKGQKPVLTLQNTMEAALNDYAGIAGLSFGDKMDNFGWQSVLSRGLKSASRVVFESDTGNKKDNVRVIVPTNLMPQMIKAEFDRAEALIAKFHSDLPASPIDALRSELNKYFIKEGKDGKVTVSKEKTEGSRPLMAVEMTGRNAAVDYSTPVPTFVKREDPSNLDIIRGFQEGGVDVVILNSSASTGISLHADQRRKDQRPRHMIVMQANPDIAVFKQTLGRIHRTGQVEWPFFTVLATGIPAERRALAVLKKKIGSLFSNTSGGEGSTGVDAVDFMNEYGDVITAKYLEENEDAAKFIGIKIPDNPSGSEIAKTASGRASLLSTDEQRDYFDTIEERFKMEIEQRNATGQNKLTRRAIDNQASPLEVQDLEEGMDESNPFTASAFITKYRVKIVEEIPSAEKVRDAIAQSLNGRTMDDIVKELESKNAVRYDESKNQLSLREAEIKAKIADKDATDKEREAYQSRLEALQRQILEFDAIKAKTISELKVEYAIGKGYRTMTENDIDASAVIIGVSIPKITSRTGNPYAPSNVHITFQRNIPGGRITVPLSKIQSGEYKLEGLTHRPNLDDWFAMREAVGGTEERWIAHGNLLRARKMVVGGEMALHTLEGHTVETPMVQGGIIMPPSYKHAAKKSSDFTIRYVKAAQDYLLAVQRAYFDPEYHADKVASYTKAMTKDVAVTKEQRTAILDNGVLLKGPNGAFLISGSPWSSSLTLTISGDMSRLAKSKELRNILEVAKKRGEARYQGSIPSDPEAIKKVLAIVGKFSPIIAPESGAEIARELTKQHFNGGKQDGSFSIGTENGVGMSVEAVTAVVDKLQAKWKNAPGIVVLESMDDPKTPPAMRAKWEAMKSAGAKGQPGGFFYEGKVYLVASGLAKPRNAVRTLLHEVIGHWGLAKTFGSGLTQVLDQIIAARPGLVAKKIAQYGLDKNNREDVLEAAEEVLVDMAQNRPELGVVRRAIAAIATWLRNNVAAFGELRLTDSEIIRDFIIPARNAVEKGANRSAQATFAYRMSLAGAGNAADNSKSTGESNGNEGRDSGTDGQPAAVGRTDGQDVATSVGGKPAAQGWAGATRIRRGGRPVAVYRGAANPLSARSFQVDRLGGASGNPSSGLGVWFTSGQREAGGYGNVQSVYLDMRNPKIIKAENLPGFDTVAEAHAYREKLRKQGYDGIIIDARHLGKPEVHFVAFDSQQVIDANANEGRFSISDVASSIRNKTLQFFGNRDKGLKTFGLYDKTLSTQYNKALKDKHFGKVFALANAMQNEVSLTSLRPSELAPGVLPRVDDFKSAMRQLVHGKRSDENMKAAANAVFAGTLDGDGPTSGRVYTDKELRTQFNLNDTAIALYRQTRAAIDASLDELAAAESYGLAQRIIPKSFRRAIVDNPQGAEALIVKEIERQIKTTENVMATAIKMGNKEHAASLAATKESFEQTLMAVKKVFATSKSLKEGGYAPLMRFGKYTVTVQSIDTETGRVARDEQGDSITEFYGQYETEGEAKHVMERMKIRYGHRDDVRITSGVKSQQSHELYSGISPETVALFAEAVGADMVMQKYIQEAMSERSALKRRLHRKGTEGYSEDLPRVLSNFITSNGRFAAQRYYMRDLNNAVKYIPKEKGDVMDEAIALKNFVLDAKDTGGVASSVMFAWFLGGSVASAMVNLTQPVMMTGPYLSQFGPVNATKALAKAMPYAMGKKQIADNDLRAAIKRASQEGIVDAQEIFHLYSVGAQGVAAGLASALSKFPGLGDKIKSGSEAARARITAFGTLWGSMFSLAEGFNRRLTFIAAWEVAKANGESNPYAFAVRAVNETQGIYNKVNRPNWARGYTGRLLLTFKQFSLMYLEMFNRMVRHGGPEGKRAALIMLAVLMLAAGEEGLPFSQDLDDLIDTIGQGLGFNTNMKRNKRRVAYEILGKELGDLFLYGLSSQLPLDFSGRMGLGNLIPGTGMFKRSSEGSKMRDMTEVFGPAGSLVSSVGDAWDAFTESNYGKAVQALMPNAAKNVAAGLDMASKGYSTDAKGRKVVNTTVTDAAMKTIGFTPTVQAEETRKTMPKQQDIALVKNVEAGIVDQYARAAVDNDEAGMKAALAKLDVWNKKNPDTPIRVSPDQFRARIKELLTDKDTRLLKQAPREMRGSLGLSAVGPKK